MVDITVWQKRRYKILKRKYGIRGKPKEKFLILCEGIKTEPTYFRSFRVPTAEVLVFGEGDNTDRLVEKAISHRNEAAKQGERFDQVWCVFDRDSFPPQNFNRALQIAKNEGVKVAYSNEAFELWYVLHFEYLCSATDRATLCGKLSRHFGREYKKNSSTIYSEILIKQSIAIQNAKRLISTYKPTDPCNNNPSTNVFILVEELNKYVN